MINQTGEVFKTDSSDEQVPNLGKNSHGETCKKISVSIGCLFKNNNQLVHRNLLLVNFSDSNLSFPGRQ